MSTKDSGWRVGDAGATVFGPKMPDGSLPEVVATITRAAVPTATHKQRARLIAAAPEMAALLERVASCGKGDGPVDLEWMHGVIDSARALLARINGGGQ